MSNMPSRLRLGCIADDFTGATDLANNLVRSGMRVVQFIGTPEGPPDVDADAVVVALKTRTIAPTDAVSQSLRAADWLLQHGTPMLYFKVCSTFDSTPKGNIGPVAEALMDRLETDFCVVTPAFPETGRTVYNGHLFVGRQLLSDSSMRMHPLTPMTQSDLVQVLQQQLGASAGRHVGLLPLPAVRAGCDELRKQSEALRAAGHSFAIADAVENDDLHALGAAFSDTRLVVAGSGLAIGIASALGFRPRPEASALPGASGTQAIISGSCSAATNGQVASFIARGGAAHAINPLGRTEASSLVDEAVAWARTRSGTGPVLVYATASPDDVRAIQDQLGADRAGALIEDVLARVAAALVSDGVRQLVVAGGETSGAVVQALGIRQMQIGPQISTGVPWCFAQASETPLHLTLKSGNFGGPDFFTDAFKTLPQG